MDPPDLDTTAKDFRLYLPYIYHNTTTYIYIYTHESVVFCYLHTHIYIYVTQTCRLYHYFSHVSVGGELILHAVKKVSGTCIYF